MTGIANLLNNLEAHNAGAAERALLQAHNVKVEAARAAGPSAEQKKISNIHTMIFQHLKLLTTDATLKPAEFYAEKPTVEYGKVFGNFGWHHTRIESPYRFYISIDDMWSQGHGRFGWGSKIGKMKLTISDYGDKKLFKELKVGGFKYADIAREIFHRISKEKAANEAAAKRQSNRTAVENVLVSVDEEFKPYNGVTVVPTTSIECPVQVVIDTKRTMSVEAATELLNVLRKHGIG